MRPTAGHAGLRYRGCCEPKRPERGFDGSEAPLHRHRDLGRDPPRLSVAGGTRTCQSRRHQPSSTWQARRSPPGRPRPRSKARRAPARRSPRPLRRGGAEGGAAAQDRGAAVAGVREPARRAASTISCWSTTARRSRRTRRWCGCWSRAPTRSPITSSTGWSAAAGEHAKLPDNDTVWTASADTLGVRPAR